MRGYVGTTDIDWYRFLRALQPLDEVNFWQPSAHGFNAPPGTPFFFKLKAPHNAIGGFGIFARYEAAPTQLAWEAFGLANGTATLAEMRERVNGYSASHARPGHRVGCIMISQPIFFDDADWIEQPTDWKKNIVSGSGYDLAQGEGLRIWQECQARTAPVPTAAAASSSLPKFGEAQLVLPRLGQGTFRIGVTSAYGGACAVSGEHSLPVLEAAHIRPYSTAGGSHDVSNGLLLRADIHRLFDRGYVTVTPDLRFIVSKRLEQEFENGRAYYKRHGKELELPMKREDRPSAEHLRWHNENIFEQDAA